MKVACIGIGAVGSIIAREIKKLDIDVTLYSRTPKDKFSILENGELTTYNYPIYALNSHHNEKYDIIFISTKATELDSLSKVVPNISHESTEIILCENGMGYDHYFSHPIPSVVYISGQNRKDYIEHFRDSHLIIEDNIYPYTDILINKLNHDSSITLKITKEKNFRQLRLEKLLINLGVNSMTALTKNTAQIFNDEDIVHLTYKLLKEGQKIINQEHEIIHDSFVRQAIQLYQSYPDHMGTSMYYDMINHIDTEYQFIHKYFYDNKKDIETPVLDVIYVLLKGYHIK